MAELEPNGKENVITVAIVLGCMTILLLALMACLTYYNILLLPH